MASRYFLFLEIIEAGLGLGAGFARPSLDTFWSSTFCTCDDGEVVFYRKLILNLLLQFVP